MGWPHVAAVVGVLVLGAVAVGGNAPVLLADVGTTCGSILLVSSCSLPVTPLLAGRCNRSRSLALQD